jgi:hypothetical protein
MSAQHTPGHTRSESSLSRLPKASIQHLYRTHVCPPRDESKADMVSVLWRRYSDGSNERGVNQSFWAKVWDEWSYVAAQRRAAIAKATGGAA